MFKRIRVWSQIVGHDARFSRLNALTPILALYISILCATTLWRAGFRGWKVTAIFFPSISKKSKTITDRRNLCSRVNESAIYSLADIITTGAKPTDSQLKPHVSTNVSTDVSTDLGFRNATNREAIIGRVTTYNEWNSTRQVARYDILYLFGCELS